MIVRRNSAVRRRIKEAARKVKNTYQTYYFLFLSFTFLFWVTYCWMFTEAVLECFRDRRLFVVSTQKWSTGLLCHTTRFFIHSIESCDYSADLFVWWFVNFFLFTAFSLFFFCKIKMGAMTIKPRQKSTSRWPKIRTQTSAKKVKPS